MSVASRLRSWFPGFFGAHKARQDTTPRSADIPENEHLWRNLRDGKRDLPAFQQEKAIEVAHLLMRTNGLAARIVGIGDEWTVGDGAVVTSRLKEEAKREKHEEAIAAVLADEQLDFERLQHEVPRTLGPVGEMLLTLFPPPTGRGMPGVGVVDPTQIHAVIVNPHNARQTMGVLLKAPTGGTPTLCPHEPFVAWCKALDAMGQQKAAAATGLWPLPPMGSEYGIKGADGVTKVMVGPTCLYFPHNRVLGATRGTSDLYADADLLDAFDRSVWQQQEAVAVRNTLAGSVSFEGASTQQEAEKIADKMNANAGRGGCWAAHNKGIEIKVDAPNLGAMDFDQHLGTVVKRVSATRGLPVTWLGLGTDAGNAATTELAGPALRMLKNYQAEVRGVLSAIVGYCLNFMAPLHGLTEEEAADFEVVLPDIGGRDASRAATALGQIAFFIAEGRDTGAWTPEKAGEMMRRQAVELMDEEFDEDDIPEAVPEQEPAKEPVADDGGGGGEPDPEEAARIEAEREEMRAAGRKEKQSRRRVKAA